MTTQPAFKIQIRITHSKLHIRPPINAPCSTFCISNRQRTPCARHFGQTQNPSCAHRPTRRRINHGIRKPPIVLQQQIWPKHAKDSPLTIDQNQFNSPKEPATPNSRSSTNPPRLQSAKRSIATPPCGILRALGKNVVDKRPPQILVGNLALHKYHSMLLGMTTLAKAIHVLVPMVGRTHPLSQHVWYLDASPQSLLHATKPLAPKPSTSPSMIQTSRCFLHIVN